MWPWSRRAVASRKKLTAFLDEGSEIEGKYTFTGTVLLNGKFQGEIASPDTLIIGERGVVNATVRAGTLVVNGQNVQTNADLVSVVIGPPTGADAKFWTLGQSAGVNANPFADTYTLLSGFSEKKTSGGTIGQTIVYAVKSVFAGVLGSTATYVETVRTAWTETGGATTVQLKEDFSNFPLIAAPGEHFILRVSSSTSISAEQLVGVGAFARIP